MMMMIMMIMTAIYYASPTKTILPTRKSVPRTEGVYATGGISALGNWAIGEFYSLSIYPNT